MGGCALCGSVALRPKPPGLSELIPNGQWRAEVLCDPKGTFQFLPNKQCVNKEIIYFFPCVSMIKLKA